MFSWIFILVQGPRRGYFLLRKSLIVPRLSDAGNALIRTQPVPSVSCGEQELSVIVAN